MWLRKQSGHDQHAAITTTITISITTSNRQWTWEYVGLDVSSPTVPERTRLLLGSGEGFCGQVGQGGQGSQGG